MLPIQLVIADPEPSRLVPWRAIFQGAAGVHIIAADFDALAASPTIQALLLTNRPFHECFGGQPRFGQAQIRATTGWHWECYNTLPRVLPPWVVSTVPFALDDERAGQRWLYFNFQVVLTCIRQRNVEELTPPIRALGLAPQTLGFSPRAPWPSEAVTQVYQAYTEHRAAVDEVYH